MVSERHPDADKSQLLAFITNRTTAEHLIRVVNAEAERCHAESLRCGGLGLVASAWDLAEMSDALYGIRDDLCRELVKPTEQTKADQ